MTDAPLALITGGVRRVGAAVARALARKGYRLALHGNSDAEPEAELATALKEAGTDWQGFQQDFSKEGAAETLMAQVCEHFGAVPDLLVNGASIFGQDPALETGEADLASHMRINFMVPTLLATALAGRRADGDRAHVVHIVDQRVRNPNRDQFAYTLSKQALAESIRTLAIACADRLRVNGVAPGLTLTAGEFSDVQIDRIRQDMPLDRLPEPEGIARAVLYLESELSVTGQMLFVDGGAHLRSYDRDFVNMYADEQ